MKNRWKTVVSVSLCVSLLLGGAGVTSYAKNRQEDKKAAQKVTEEKKENKREKDTDEDETLYVFSDASGSIEKIVVSDEMREMLGNKISRDDEKLLGMKEDLPVTMKVTYKLDGKEISPEELAGKSGHVIIRYDYENTRVKQAKVGGKNKNIYVPYVMITGLILDNDIFSNVEVSNGKTLDDGDRTIVAGVALPGVQENLNISKKDLEIPDSVEIKADVKNFDMMETMTVATNEVFSDMDASKLNDIDDLKEQMNQLTDAIAQLIDGSRKLEDGLNTLNEKTGELAGGVGKLTEGVDALHAGAGELDKGVAKLNAGAEELASGLAQLSSKNQELVGGATQVFHTLLRTGSDKLAEAGLASGELTIDNYAKVLDQVIQSLDKEAVYAKALAQVTQAVEEKRPLIQEEVTKAVRKQVEVEVTSVVRREVQAKVEAAVKEEMTGKVIEAATAAMGHPMTREQYEKAVAAGLVSREQQEQIQTMIEEKMQSAEGKALVQAQTDAKMQSKEVQQLIQAKTEEQMQTEKMKNLIAENTELQVQQKISEVMASEEIQKQLQAASEGAKSVIQLKASLDSYNSFYLGLITYTNGVSTAAEGAKTLLEGSLSLKEGTQKLFAGSTELKNGVGQLAGNTPALIDGVSQLKDGSVQLNAGLKEFNEKGIEKLVQVVNGDVSNLIDRAKAMIHVSNEIDRPVKIIFRTNKISTEE